MRAHPSDPTPSAPAVPLPDAEPDRRTAQPRSAPRAPRGHRPRVPRPRRRPPRQGRAGPPDQPRPPDGLIRIRAAGARGGGRPARPGGASSCTRRPLAACGPAARTPVGCPATPRSVHDVATPTSRCTVWWAAPVDPEAAPGAGRTCSTTTSATGSPASAARPTGRATSPRTRSPGSSSRRSRERRPMRLAFDRTCRCGAPHGKPVLPGGPGFSLSHAGDLVGVAVRPDGPVGLDVEQVRDVADLDALAGHVRSPAERARAGLGPRRVLPHLDPQGGPGQGHRRRAVDAR